MAMRVVAHYSWPQSLTCFLMPPPRTPPLKGNINFCWSCSWIPHLDVASVERSFPWLERLFAADLVACLSVMRWAHSTFSDISIYKAQNLRITPSIAFYIRPKNTHTAEQRKKTREKRRKKRPSLASLLAAESLLRQHKSKIQFCIFMPTAVHWIWLGGTAPAAIYDSSQVAHAATAHRACTLHGKAGWHSRQMESFRADMATQCILNEPQTRCAFISLLHIKRFVASSHVVPDNLNQ